MWSANLFNLDQSRNLLFGNGPMYGYDTVYQTKHYQIVPSPIARSVAYPFPKQALVFTYLQYNSFENTVGKGEIACNKFLLFPQCFLLVCRTSCHFHQALNCHLQSLSVWNSLKFVVWEMV